MLSQGLNLIPKTRWYHQALSYWGNTSPQQTWKGVEIITIRVREIARLELMLCMREDRVPSPHHMIPLPKTVAMSNKHCARSCPGAPPDVATPQIWELLLTI